MTSQVSKVMHVLGGLGHGGTERLCFDMIRFSPKAVEHTIVVMDPSLRAMEKKFREEANADIAWLSGHGSSRTRFLLSALRTLRKVRPQAVLVYSIGVPHLIFGIAGRICGIPIHGLAGNPSPAKGESERWKWAAIIALSQLIGTPIHSFSNTIQASLMGLGYRMPKGSGMILNGCDTNQFSIESSVHSDWGARPVIVGMVARLDKIKDQATLIEAIALLAPRIEPTPELWLIGDGDQRQRLEHLAVQLGVGPNVRFLGARDDVARLLGLIDLYAFSTSSSEGLGLALIEAMAAGKPIVASDVCACREVLDGGKVGRLVPCGDPQALANTMEELIEFPNLRSTLGMQARARAKQCYDVTNSAQKWYESILDEPMVTSR